MAEFRQPIQRPTGPFKWSDDGWQVSFAPDWLADEVARFTQNAVRYVERQGAVELIATLVEEGYLDDHDREVLKRAAAKIDERAAEIEQAARHEHGAVPSTTALVLGGYYQAANLLRGEAAP